MIPAGTRRSKIRAPRRSIVAQEPVVKHSFDYDASWAVLAHAIRSIQNKNVNSLSYEQLYRIAYTLVLEKCGDRLYEDVGRLIGEHLRTRREQLLKEVGPNVGKMSFGGNQGFDLSGENQGFSLGSDFASDTFLARIAREWNDHLSSMKLISDILMYMNRVYVKDHHKLYVYDMGISLFESNFLRPDNSPMADLVIRMVCDEMGSSVVAESLTSKSHISQILSMFEVMADEKYAQASNSNIYNEFESPLVASCRHFYSEYASSALSDRSGTLYLQKITDLIGREESRMEKFSTPLFSAQTKPKLIGVMNETLIKDNLDKIMGFPVEMHGLVYWLEPVLRNTLERQNLRASDVSESENHFQQLSSLYTLEGRIDPERKRLKTHLRNIIVSQGLQLPVEIRRSLEEKASLQETNGQKKVSVGPQTTAFAVEWIEAILQYQKCLGELVQNAFQSDPAVEFTVFASLKQFINHGSGSSNSGVALLGSKKKEPVLNAPELLSVYMDHHIKQTTKQKKNTGSASMDPNTMEGSLTVESDFLNKSVCFLKLVEDKHAFENHYAAHFAKRFLNTKSSSFEADDVEDVVISKLWEEVFMGSHHLERIVKMRKDVKSSAELTKEWRQYVVAGGENVENQGSNQDAKDVNFSGETRETKGLLNLDLKICNLAEWPKSMTKDHQMFGAVEGQVGFIWPKQLRPTMKVFEEFWLTGKKNDNKALYWYPKFGSMDLCITYPSRTYEINMSTYAGIIMLLFAPQSSEEDQEVSAFDQKIVLTYNEIYELTRIPEADLKRQLRSIAVAPRSRLLIKSPMSKDISSSDTFQLNSKFKAPSSKVKVLTVKSEGPEKTEEPPKEVNVNINEGKEHLINASIVRVMKSRKTIKHNDLIEEIIKQLQTRFLPSMIHIKQRIEDLIEKEYLRRDPDLPGVYHYIA